MIRIAMRFQLSLSPDLVAFGIVFIDGANICGGVGYGLKEGCAKRSAEAVIPGRRTVSGRIPFYLFKFPTAFLSSNFTKFIFVNTNYVY